MITLPKEILKEIMRNRRHINAHKRGQARTCNLLFMFAIFIINT